MQSRKNAFLVVVLPLVMAGACSAMGSTPVSMEEVDGGCRVTQGTSVETVALPCDWVMALHRASHEYRKPRFSDRRLKAAIEPLPAPGDKLTAIEAVRYVYTPTGERRIGVIAQQLQPHYPQLVHQTESGLLQVDYAGLTAVLLAEVQQLNKRVEALESRLAGGQERRDTLAP